MEQIQGYDEWKTSPPEEPEVVTRCSLCGKPLYEGDYLFTVQDDALCEECMNDEFRRML